MSALRSALAILAFLSLGAPGRQEIAFRVAAGTTLARTVKNQYSMRLESMKFTMDGEEVPGDAFGEVDIRIDHSEDYVVTDVFEAVADGRPQRLRRTFDQLGERNSSSLSSAEGESSDASDYESALEGKTVVFSWDEESGSFGAAFAAGGGGDESLLEDLDEDMDLRSLLPDMAPSPGESWSIDAKAFGRILEPGGDLRLEVTEGEERDTSAQDAELRANLSGEITATLENVLEEGGVRQAAIALKVDTRSHSGGALGPDELPEGASGTRLAEIHFLLEGELRWDLEHGHALSLELSGENELTSTEKITSELDGESVEQSQTVVFSGETKFSMLFERR